MTCGYRLGEPDRAGDSRELSNSCAAGARHRVRLAWLLRRFAFRDGPADIRAAALFLCVLLVVGLATPADTIALVLLKKICPSQNLIARSRIAPAPISRNAAPESHVSRRGASREW